MAILSAEQTFSDNQDLSQVAAAYASTNYIDLGAAGTPYGGAAALTRDVAKGCPVPFDVIVTETFVGATATLTVVLEMDDNTSFSSSTAVLTSPAHAVTVLVAGFNCFAGLYLPIGITERYVRLEYTIGTATTTAGTITAGLTAGRQTNLSG